MKGMPTLLRREAGEVTPKPEQAKVSAYFNVDNGTGKLRGVYLEENEAVHAMVQAIADETFVGLFATPHVPIGDADWFAAWVAILKDEIAGVTMTRGEWVCDLWVRQDSRRLGIGARLLAHAEEEIRGRGHGTFRLRVVKSNRRAVRFYESQGWEVHREFPHEKYGHAMFDMRKAVPENEKPGRSGA
jgi:ribosomal protein S18 acetylase RimI-like enzyme